MQCDPYKVVRDFEKALCDYTGAKYAVAVTSCTMALQLAIAWNLRDLRKKYEVTVNPGDIINGEIYYGPPYPVMAFITPKLAFSEIQIPNRTYVSVPMAVIHAGGCPKFVDFEWSGSYRLRPLPVWDSARRFTSGMYQSGTFQCVSFHWSKILAIGQGGAILHDNDEADAWLRRARFDGRAEGVDPKDDTFSFVGWHCYMSPRDAAEGLSRLTLLPDYNADLPNSDYPDLSQLEIFK